MEGNRKSEKCVGVCRDVRKGIGECVGVWGGEARRDVGRGKKRCEERCGKKC